jgi:hypothetical protein
MAHAPGHKKLSDDSVVRGHETSDANVKSVFVNGIGLSIGLMVVGLLVSWGAYEVFKSSSVSPGASANTFVVPDPNAQPPLPRLQADPHAALVPFLKTQDSILTSYGWVNKDSGLVRIPIERAMELMVKKGLQVAKP